MKIKKIFTLLVLLSLLFIKSFYICAEDYTNFIADSANGWTLNTSEDYDKTPLVHTHMGTAITTYSFSDDIPQNYRASFLAAISLWSEAAGINLQEVSENGMGIVKFQDQTDPIPSSANAGGFIREQINNHVTRWVIAIQNSKFQLLSETERIVVLAHEIGHIYGLGHLPVDISYKQHIMYPVGYSDQYIHDAEILGMQVCTHQHTHTLRAVSGSGNHINQCTTCLGYYQQDHALNATAGTCTELSKCSVCQVTVSGAALASHNFNIPATCTEPAKCACGATQGSAAGHSFTESSY